MIVVTCFRSESVADSILYCIAAAFGGSGTVRKLAIYRITNFAAVVVVVVLVVS